MGGTPFIEFDDGTCLAETVALCDYLDSVAVANGARSMWGQTPLERATVGMWLRRIEQHIVMPIYARQRWGVMKEFFAGRGMHGMLANDTAAEQQFAVAKSQIEWLDEVMVKAG